MMKYNKMLCTFLAVILVMLMFTACRNKDENLTSTTKTEQTTILEKESSKSKPSKSDESETTDKKNNSVTQENVGGGVNGLSKYRAVYYNVPRPYIDVVNSELYSDWLEDYLEGNDWNQGNTNGMAMKASIQHFNISREDFDKANLKWAKMIKIDFKADPCMNPKDFGNQELDEIYNGDIIYTFDDEVINAYYLGHEEEFYPYWYQDEFKEAVEKGEYTSKTEVWVDVAQMEADIIEKYGSVD